MRELLLIVIVGLTCCVGIVRPVAGLFGYTWFALMRPDVLAYSYGVYPYSMALAVGTGLGMLRFLPNFVLVLTNPVCLGLLAMQVPIAISVFNSQYPIPTWLAYENYLRVVAMALLIPALVDSVRTLRAFLLVAALSLGLLGAKFGLFGLMQGGVRLVQGYGGMLTDNNDIALALAMTVPMLWRLRQTVEWRPGRLAMLGIMFLTMAAVVMTHSRGGAITLAAVMLLLTMRSRRKLGILVLFVALAAPAVYMVRETYVSRISTVANPDEESSAVSRMSLARAAVRMWKDYPLFGVGFGGRPFSLLVHRYNDVVEGSVAHNTYLQMLADCGIFALIAYVSLLWGVILWLGFAAARVAEALPVLAACGRAVQEGLIAFAVGSIFLSRTHFDALYILLMSAAAWLTARNNALVEIEEPDAEAEETAAEPVPTP